MSSVPVPPLVAPRRRAAYALLGAVLAAALIAAAVVLARPHAEPAAAPGPAPPRTAEFDGWIGGVPMQQATCAQWTSGTAHERTGAVAALRATVGAASTTGGYGTSIPDGRAARMFDARCAQPGAAGFLLYEIYIRAAAFGG